MPEQSRLGARQDGHDLGASFEQSNSPSFSGDLGPSFEEHNRGPKDNPRRKWYWIGGILILVVLIFLVHQFSGDTTGTKPAAGNAAAGGGRGRGQQGPAAITIGQSKTGNMPVYVQALGTVTPTYTVTLYSQITGQVMSVHYTEGQLVKKGQPLVDIDPRPSQATLDQAEATLKHDQSVLDEAQMDLKRYQDANTAIARQQLEDQEKLVTQEEATTQVDEANIAFDKVQLSYCHIVSPIAGRVGLRLVDPGNTVFSGSSSTLVVVTALQPITVVFNVSEDDLPSVQAQLKIQKALPVDAFDRADDNMIESGKLTSLDNQIDTTTGTLKFRATYANKGLDLFPNQFVNSRLLLTTLKNATLVPNAAVQHNGTAAFVYIVNSDNTVSVQNVTVSTSDDQYTAVSGLNSGVTVATSGFDRLEQGAKVRPQVPGQKGAHGASGTTTSPDGSPSTASGKGKGGHGSGASAQ